MLGTGQGYECVPPFCIQMFLDEILSVSEEMIDMKTTAFIIVAGFAAAASAQTMTLSWTTSGTIFDGGTGTATLWASMDPGATGFAGSIYDFSTDGAGTYIFDNLLDALTNDGTDDGMGNVTNIESFQLPPFFNPDFVADNPIAIATFTYTPDTYTPHTVSFTTANHQNFSVYTDDFGTSAEYAGVVNGGSFDVVPAPASMALLGLGGLVATRRRR